MRRTASNGETLIVDHRGTITTYLHTFCGVRACQKLCTFEYTIDADEFAPYLDIKSLSYTYLSFQYVFFTMVRYTYSLAENQLAL
jgi:hypothetical protein